MNEDSGSARYGRGLAEVPLTPPFDDRTSRACLAVNTGRPRRGVADLPALDGLASPATPRPRE